MNKPNLPTPPSGRGAVQTSLGRPGGPGFQTYNPPRETMQGPRAWAVRIDNESRSSINLSRPGQEQPRDDATAYMFPKPNVPDPAAGRPSTAPETGLGRPGGPRAVGAAYPSLARAPAPGGVETDMTGRQPYAGRDAAMERTTGPAISATADSETHPGAGGLSTAMSGPVGRSGNFPGNFDPRMDTSAAAEGLAKRNALRALARGNGGVPADLENPTPRMRFGGLRDTMQSHEAGAGGIGISPPGPNLGQGYESHNGPGDGSGPEKC